LSVCFEPLEEFVDWSAEPAGLLVYRSGVGWSGVAADLHHGVTEDYAHVSHSLLELMLSFELIEVFLSSW
jgi:hypothetical protein